MEWLVWGFIGGFALLGLAHLIKSRISRSKEGPNESEKKPAPRFQPWSLPAPQTPTLLDEPSDWTPPPEVAALRGFDRVFTGGGGLSITPDGREALVLHSNASATLFDVASGRALHTWTNICPPEWLENEVDFFFMSAKAQRIFLTLSENVGGETDFILIDLEKRAVTLLHTSEGNELTMASASMSGNGNLIAGFHVYSTYHPLLDLETPEYDEFGDIKLEGGMIWPTTALTRDGWCLAYEQGDGSVVVTTVGDAEDEEDGAPHWDRSKFRGEMRIIGDDSPHMFDFSSDGRQLVIVEDDGGFVIADLEAEDQQLLKPLPPLPDDQTYNLGRVLWLNNRDQVILELDDPQSKLLLIDVTTGAIEREWLVGKDIRERLRISRTGGFGLFISDDDVIRVLPLLDDAA